MIVQDMIKAKAIQLLTPYRFDIVAKYIYAKSRVNGIHSEFAENLYKNHIQIWNGFFENEPRKTCYEDFKNAFDKLIDDIGKNGFKPDESPIPIAYNGSPLNGAHRLAASLVFENDVQCYMTDEPQVGQLDCSYYFFATRRNNVPSGMTIPMSDPIALEYARLKPDCRLLCLFSHTVSKEPEIDEILMNYGLPVYEKRFNLDEHGRVNLMRQLYKGEEWIKDRSSYFYGARVKAARCFSQGKHMRVMLFDPRSNADLVRMKAEIRELFGVGKDSIHINDTYEETIRLGELFFNNNSLISSNNFHATDRNQLAGAVRWLKRQCRRQNIDTSSLCLAGPAVLAAYGIHDSGEIQVISHGEAPKGFECINELVESSDLKRTELIYDPANFLYFEGMKVLALNNEQVLNHNRKTLTINKLVRNEVTDCFSALNVYKNSKNIAFSISSPKTINNFLKRNDVDVVYEQDINWKDQELPGVLGLKSQKELLLIIYRFNETIEFTSQKESLNIFLNTEENYLMLDQLINENTKHFNQFRKEFKLETFDQGFKAFKQWLQQKNIDPKDVCIDGSAVLSAYGLRDCADFDFLYFGLSIATCDKLIDCHNYHYQELKEQMNLTQSINDIIYDSQNHFYFSGIKFCSLNLMKHIKSKRLVNGQRQRKDDEDFQLINTLIQAL